MIRNLIIIMLAVVAVFATVGCRILSASGGEPSSQAKGASAWQEDFDISKRTLVTTGRNPYYILEPGYQLTFASDDEKLVITVLDKTMDVGGVTTRIVEEREWKNGQLIEVSRNFFAICNDTKDVFYFGEEVDDYKNSEISGHGGAWRADTFHNKPGLVMPGSPKIGMKYYQEIAPDIAMDRAEVVSLDEAHKTPVGTFTNCLKTQEGSALKPGEKEFKLYAQEVGLLQDGEMLLVKYGYISH